jgi:hypothetical protein
MRSQRANGHQTLASGRNYAQNQIQVFQRKNENELKGNDNVIDPKRATRKNEVHT